MKKVLENSQKFLLSVKHFSLIAIMWNKKEMLLRISLAGGGGEGGGDVKWLVIF